MTLVVLVIVGAAVGAAVAWFITHQYYVKAAAKEQSVLLAQFSAKVRQAMLDQHSPEAKDRTTD